MSSQPLSDSNTTADALLDGRLKLRHIRFVLAVAEQGTLVRAAESLFVTQPVVTRALAETEEILGTELFVRGPKGVTPTPFGEGFLRDAGVIAARLRDLQRRIDLNALGKGGHLIIGNHLSGSTSVLPQAIAAFKQECPEVRVSIREASPDELVRLLSSGVVDVVVGRLSAQFRDPDFVLEELFREPVCAVARSDHQLFQSPGLTLSSLRDVALILPLPQTALRGEIEWCFAKEHVPLPTNIIETTSILVMRSIVLAGDTIAILPQYFAGPNSGLRILPIEFSVEHSVGVITQGTREVTTIVQRFIEILRAQSKTVAERYQEA